METDQPQPVGAPQNEVPGRTTDSPSSFTGEGVTVTGEAVRSPVRSRIEKLLNWKVLAIFVVAIVCLIALSSIHANTQSSPGPIGPPPVAVAKVAREDLFKEVTIPAEFRPYTEVTLHAKVSGYLQQINVDFGDHVKAGQLLATLEVPELLDELHSAVAVEQKAQADYTNAHLVHTRLDEVNRQHPNLVAQQDLDTAEANNNTAAAAIAAAKANAEKYKTLLSYTKITAPFDGIVTHRYADPGALIQSGTASDTQSMPLVRLSDNYHLRMDFYVDVGDVKDIHLGDLVEVRVGSLGGQTFTGKVSRFTDRVEEDTRKMTTEIEVPNPTLELVPGMYATVVLKVQRHPEALAVPIEAVSAGKKNSIFVVDANNKVEERSVTLGLETPTKYEILSGLKEGELVMLGNPGQIKPGEKVETKLVP